MFQKQADAELQEAIDRLLLAMKASDPNSVEYEQLVERLSSLNAIKAANAKNALSKDTIATICANLFGIWLILHYERVNIIGSKALSYVQKLR